MGDTPPSSPDTELHIKSDTPVITLQRTDNEDRGAIEFQGQGGTVGAHIEYVSDVNDLSFGTFDGSNVHEKLRLEDGSTGNIKVSGSTQITGSLYVSGAYYGDGSQLSGITSGIFQQTGSFQATTSDLQITGSVTATGNVTASGNISSSANITGSDIYAGGSFYGDGSKLSNLAGGIFVATGSSYNTCLLYTSPSPRDQRGSRMPSSA